MLIFIILVISPAGHTQEIGIGRFRELSPRYIRILLEILTLQIWFRYQPPYRISRSIDGTSLKITNFTPLINALVVPSLMQVG